ncbi:peptidoglycan DD-metalloendopeptidase family protein [Corynebacterium sp. A21]|uniref:peptidoglycan DD-metalloendopeptidase family protein n=1 Tax=Corynebacterium sp. A21 TaxID=3457318 RepID=UPI003FD2E700
MTRESYTLTSGFGPRWGSHHSGLDFGAADGTPFYACAGGTVTHIGAASGYGQWIVLDHPTSEGGGASEYGHMWNAFATGLSVGDWVDAGQLLGYVGSNGQSTGPHLHLTVWQYGYGGTRIDPEDWLQDAPHPGETSTPATFTGPIFGVDISNWQNGILAELIGAEGFRFCIIKATEGTWRDPILHSHLADVRKNSSMHVGAYVYVRHDVTPQAHADTLHDHLGDTSVPIAMDIENGSGSSVAHFKNIREAIEAKGYRVILTYLPNWYWKQIGKPNLTGLPPLWTSRYPDMNSGVASVIYSRAGDKGWDGYGGLDVAVWQFTSTAMVAGQLIDANAFRGSVGELHELFTGESHEDGELTVSQADRIIQELKDYIDVRVTGPIGSDVKDIRQQLTGGRNAGEYPGWPQNGKNAEGNDLSTNDAVAATRQDIAELRNVIESKEKK